MTTLISELKLHLENITRLSRVRYRYSPIHKTTIQISLDSQLSHPVKIREKGRINEE